MGYQTEVAEGRQGETVYYTGSMDWGELVKQIVFPYEFDAELVAQGEENDDDRMQRALATKRIPALVDYLNEPDHFFSAVTLIILPTDLSKPALDAAKAGPDEDADYKFEQASPTGLGRQKRGTLYLSGSVRLFPADGQHRITAAEQAIKRGNKKLAKEEVPVVLVPYRRPDQVRQLFADLNLNAKPVSKTVGLDFDTRSPMVLLAKHVAREVPLFTGRVNRISNSLSRTSRNVITMNTLYQGTESLLKGAFGAALEEELRAVHARDSELGTLGDTVVELWGELIEPFSEEWEPVLNDEDGAAGALRDTYVFPHGLGWQALAQALGMLVAQYPDDYAKLYRATVDAIDWKRTNGDWQNRAMSGERVNNTGPGIKATADYIVDMARQTL